MNELIIYVKLNFLDTTFVLHIYPLYHLILFSLSAISVLWIEFVREVRWCWEESQPLPRMPSHGSIDLTTCLINQKLQMVI
jgi:hypothetical protein